MNWLEPMVNDDLLKNPPHPQVDLGMLTLLKDPESAPRRGGIRWAG